MEKIYYEYLNMDWEESKVRLDTGIDMAYCEFGSDTGIPLLLIHGVTDGSISWAQVAPVMAQKGYHCYAIEYRGNGMTDKPDMGEEGYTAELIADDILNFMDKLNLEKTHVAGHSFGSLISQVLAIKAPERFLSYILIDSAVDATGCIALDILKGDGGEFPDLNSFGEYMPAEFVKTWTAVENEDGNFRRAVYEHAAQLPIIAWKNLMRGLVRFDNRAHIGEITGDVLVIWGTGDDIFTAKDQEQLKAGLTSCRVKHIDVEGASHNGFWDSIASAEKYCDYMDEFIKSL